MDANVDDHDAHRVDAHLDTDAADADVDVQAPVFDASVSDAALNDARVEPDAASDAGDVSPLEGTETTNMPGAIVMYEGMEAPRLTFLASHLFVGANDGVPIGPVVYLYARLRNETADTLCRIALDVTLIDSEGTPLAAPDLIADEPTHDTPAGYAPCVGPGEEFFAYGATFGNAAVGTITPDRVAVISWDETLVVTSSVAMPADDASISDLDVVPGELPNNYVLTGTLTNLLSTPLGTPGVVAYVVNRGGQPVWRLIDTREDLPGDGTWQFETSAFSQPFTPADVEHVIRYYAP